MASITSRNKIFDVLLRRKGDRGVIKVVNKVGSAGFQRVTNEKELRSTYRVRP